MTSDYVFAIVLHEALNINIIEALYLEDCLKKTPLSWSYAPGNVRYSLQNLISLRVVKIVDRTFEGDTQVYKFVELSDIGRELIGKALGK